jgi:hypothetical protein
MPNGMKGMPQVTPFAVVSLRWSSMTHSRLVIGVGAFLLTVVVIGLLPEKERPTASTPAPATAATGYYGEHIVHVGNSREGSVGYKFKVVSLACFHLWTWGGTYCVYEPVLDGTRLTDKYRPISPAEAARLLGKNESELQTPFWYRFPPGLIVLGAFVFFLGICAVLRVCGLLPRNALTCPQCGRRQAAGTQACPCGHVFGTGPGT